MDSQRQDSLEDRYLNVQEAAALLDIGEDELWQLVHKHQVPTHNIAGAFLRFKKEHVEELKNKWRIERELFPVPAPHFPHRSTVEKTLFSSRLADFWYFNDFYVVCSVLMVVLLYFIISSQ